jgi:hypothetical protein
MAEYSASRAAEEAAQQIKEKREAQAVSDRALAEFFARGGEVQKIANNVSGRVEGASYSAWGKPKKRAAAVEEDTTEVVEIEDDTAAPDDDAEESA